jgi:hypothetical protein
MSGARTFRQNTFVPWTFEPRVAQPGDIGCESTIGPDMEENFVIDLLQPVGGQNNVGVDILLEWRGYYSDGRPLDSDLVWDVYLAEYPSSGGLVAVATGLPPETYQYDPSDALGDDLKYGRSYWWRVVARRTACAAYGGLSSSFNVFSTVGDFEARRLPAGDYVFGFVLFNSETGRTSAFSEVAQVRQFEFESGSEQNALYAAMEITYDSVKYDQAFIYRSVKVQDAGGTYIAAIMHLENIIELSTYHTVNNGVGKSFPPSVKWRQSVYYYQLEDKQLVQKEPFLGHNIFDEKMPQGGTAMMFHGALVMAKILGGSSSSSESLRQNDAFTGLGELRWSSSQYFSPELFPPLNQDDPETPSNEIVKLRKAGHNAIGFSKDRMYHLRKEGDTVRSREIHKGYGVVNHRSTEEVGSVIFFVSQRGLKTVDAFAKLDEIHAIDEVIIERWKGANNAAAISMAHDPTLGALFIHNSLQEETQVIWFNSSMLTSIDDMSVELTVRGAWPDDPSDYDDTLVSRAFFLKNIPYSESLGLEETDGKKPEILLVDYARTKNNGWNSPFRMKSTRMYGKLFDWEQPWGVIASAVASYVTFEDDIPLDMEGGYLYVLQHPTDPSFIGQKWKIHGIGDGSDPKKLWTELNTAKGQISVLPAGTIVGFMPVHVDVRGAALGLVGEDGTPFSGLEYHRMRQIDGLGAVFTDVNTVGASGDDGKILDRFYATVFRGSDDTVLDRTFPKDLDGSNVVSVVNDEGVYFAAYGGDDTGGEELMDGSHGIQGTVLIPGFETFSPDLDYRLLSLLVTGKILDTERRTQPTV